MKLLYILVQCTYGILQTFLGGIIFLINVKHKHCFYHGAVITYWKLSSSLSLGMFIFVTDNPYCYPSLHSKWSPPEVCERLIVHEYGHTIQSLILGPLYLIVMGIPSFLWAFIPALNRMRKEKSISYFSFFTERWANHLGEKVLKKKSMENALIN
ncbi:MAG: hypothetical protein IKT65_03695 [Clostridia bacterium]|nr:hypothetical protein [Clostridia bacterium]